MLRKLSLGLLGALLLAQTGRDLRIEPAPAVNSLKDRGTRWAVVVGISSHEFLPPAAQLRFAHRDAEDFASFLRSGAGGAIPGNNIRLLANEQASLAEIRAALHTWLPAVARPEDIVYVFFAGHGILDDNNDGYFVAHDSDPQNLHATALSFDEVDQTLSGRLRAGLVVLVTDACHTGRLGWSTYSPANPSRAAEPLARIGQGDRSFLKLLSTRPTEKAYEDPQWDGGHGVFTHALLEGLYGQADRDGDRVVRAAEAIDFVTRRVPELTGAQQHPRVAGTFDAQLPMAVALQSIAPATQPVTLDISGPPHSSVYIDHAFRGRIRSSGILRIDSLMPGQHAFSADFTDGTTLDGKITLGNNPAKVTIADSRSGVLGQLRARIDAGQVLEPSGAWDLYRSATFGAYERAIATSLIVGALESLGQACVGDYVQSTAVGPKRLMLQRAVDAYGRLRTLRPSDTGLEARELFCRGRIQILEGRFAEAVVTLENSLKRDSRFACSYNALGVAYSRINRPKDARAAFDMANKLTPEWALPLFQIATLLSTAGDAARALPYMQKAVACSPKSLQNRWGLMHLERLLGHTAEVERQATEIIRLQPDYAPVYFELGLAYEAARNYARAMDAYDTYIQLAPNFADTNAVRNRLMQLRRR